MKNWPFCDVLTTAEHFAQVLVLKHTRNGQLGGRCQHVSLGCRYHADVQTKVQGSAGRQDSGQFWREGKMRARSIARQTKLWVEPDIHVTPSKHYDISLNNQQCFDFLVWESAQRSRLGRGVPIPFSHSSQITIS